MHRLTQHSSRIRVSFGPFAGLAALGGLSLGLVAASGLGCGNAKPADTAVTETTSDAGLAKNDRDVASGADGGALGALGEPKKDECIAFDVSNLEDLLLKSACEETDRKPDAVQPVDLTGKLAVTLTASPTKPAPGSKVDLLVTFTNKTAAPLMLHFKTDPLPRFEVEAYDTKKAPKRVDLPAGEPPPPPKGATQPPPGEVKMARVTLAPNGNARVRIPWETVKTKWAPEKFRGTPPERGYPRASAGPLPKGKYNIKVISPLVGVSEGVEHEMTAPHIELDIGG